MHGESGYNLLTPQRTYPFFSSRNPPNYLSQVSGNMVFGMPETPIGSEHAIA